MAGGRRGAVTVATASRLWAKGRGGEERSPEWEGAERGVGPLPPAGYATTGRHGCSLRLRRRIRDGRTRVPCAQARCKQNGAGQGRPLPLAHRGARSRRRGAAQRGRGARRQALLGRWLGRPQRRDRRRTHAPHGSLPPCTMTGRGPLSSPVPRPQPRGRSGAGERECGRKSQTGDKWRPGARSAGLGTLMFCRWEWSVPVTLDPRLSRPLEGR